MEYISRSLPLYVYVIWVFVFPVLIGFGTHSISAFWIFLAVMAMGYYLYARNFYLITKDSENLYAKNPTNIFAKKYVIPLSSIENYQIYTSLHRKGIFIQTKSKETIFIPCYKLSKKV
jgi:hypothetical protein